MQRLAISVIICILVIGLSVLYGIAIHDAINCSHSPNQDIVPYKARHIVKWNRTICNKCHAWNKVKPTKKHKRDES